MSNDGWCWLQVRWGKTMPGLPAPAVTGVPAHGEVRLVSAEPILRIYYRPSANYTGGDKVMVTAVRPKDTVTVLASITVSQ